MPDTGAEPPPFPFPSSKHGKSILGCDSQQATACGSPNLASALHVVDQASRTVMSNLRSGCEFQQPWQMFMFVTLFCAVHMQ